MPQEGAPQTATLDPERLQQPDIPGALVTDLIHSFRLSQGQPDAQTAITDLVSYEYAAQVPQEELEEAWPAVEAQVAALGIPGEHEPKEEQTIRDEFERALGVFRAGLDKAYNEGRPSEE